MVSERCFAVVQVREISARGVQVVRRKGVGPYDSVQAGSHKAVASAGAYG